MCRILLCGKMSHMNSTVLLLSHSISLHASDYQIVKSSLLLLYICNRIDCNKNRGLTPFLCLSLKNIDSINILCAISPSFIRTGRGALFHSIPHTILYTWYAASLQLWPFVDDSVSIHFSIYLDARESCHSIICCVNIIQIISSIYHRFAFCKRCRILWWAFLRRSQCDGIIITKTIRLYKTIISIHILPSFKSCERGSSESREIALKTKRPSTHTHTLTIVMKNSFFPA